MTSLRKWRFPILIGSGVIAAGALVYFSNAHVSTNKTQGAIGQREVYRDGQVASADVATPGSAPVATEAILEGSEFKALAKNPAFQELMKNNAFHELALRHEFLDLLANSEFRAAVQNQHFAELVDSAQFQVALRDHQDLSLALKNDLTFGLILRNESMMRLIRMDAFQKMAANQAFDKLLSERGIKHTFVETEEWHVWRNWRDYLADFAPRVFR